MGFVEMNVREEIEKTVRNLFLFGKHGMRAEKNIG